jgi:GT2 family glycosyltransferase
MLISIVLPYFGRWDLTHARMAELYKHAPDNCEIILVNDASNEPECRTGVGFWQKGPAQHKIIYVENKKNLGFGGSHNKGAKAANGDILIFLSNDVIIRTDFVTPIIETIEENRKCLIGGRIVAWAAGWNQFETDDGKPFIIPYCEGWLLACHKEIWDTIGGFDVKSYQKFDMEDVDLSMTALSLGYDLRALSFPPHMLRHISGATIGKLNIDRMAITTRNKEIFIEKWQSKFTEIFETLEKLQNDR